MINGRQQISRSVLVVALISFALYFIFSSDSRVLASVTVTATVPSVCGNGILEPGEQCEGADLNNRTCLDFNFSTGTLSCSGACSFDISQCSGLGPPPPPPPSGGGGGGGGGGGPDNSMTGVTFVGKAYPLSKVTLLKDGITAVSSITGPDASFSLSLNSFIGGNYTFSLFAEDSKGRRSNLFTVSVYVTTGASTVVKGIYLAPTIAIDKIEVKKNDILAVFGQSTPQSNISIMVNSENELMKQTSTDEDGVYLYNLDTSLLEYGQHGVSSRATNKNDISGTSPVLSFKVSDKNIVAPVEKPAVISDVNQDGHVNLVDFSIAAFWFKKSGFPKEIDLNGDGKVDLVDFSILAYHWTG